MWRHSHVRQNEKIVKFVFDLENPALAFDFYQICDKSFLQYNIVKQKKQNKFKI